MPYQVQSYIVTANIDPRASQLVAQIFGRRYKHRLFIPSNPGLGTLQIFLSRVQESIREFERIFRATGGVPPSYMRVAFWSEEDGNGRLVAEVRASSIAIFTY